MDDTALVLAARSGDRDALAAIYDRYADRLYDYCWSLLRDRHEAADAFHDAFVAASKRLGQLRDPEKLRPWLYAIARHESLRRVKARGRQTPTEQISDMPASVAEPDEGARREDAVRLVWDAAAGLAERDRALLDLNLRHNLEGQELADAIGVERAHAYVLLNRMRAQVERSLGALLVARYGRADCSELAHLLAGWDGRLSPLIRKRVARHADDCPTCSERRRKMASPLALLSAVPLVRAPAELRDRVLGDAQLVSHATTTRQHSGDGFPPSDHRRRSGRVLGATAAVMAAVVAMVALLLFPTSDDGTVLPTTAGATTTTTATAATTAAPVAETSTKVAPSGLTVSPAPTTAGTSSSTATTTTTAAVGGGPFLRLATTELDFGAAADRRTLELFNDGGVPLTWAAAASPGAFGADPAAGSIPPAGTVRLMVSLDRSALVEGPVSGVVRISSAGGAAEIGLRAMVVRPPNVVRLNARDARLATSPCSVVPTVTPVEATVEDESQIASVTLRWRDPSGDSGERVMQAATGSVFRGRLGSFSTAGTVVWWVEATDSLGATGRSADQAIPVGPCPRQ